jgi:hypothetical protein
MASRSSRYPQHMRLSAAQVARLRPEHTDSQTNSLKRHRPRSISDPPAVAAKVSRPANRERTNSAELQDLHAARLRDAAEIARLKQECEARATEATAAEHARSTAVAEASTLRAELDNEVAAHRMAMEKVASLQHDAAAAASNVASRAAGAAAAARRPFELRLGIAPGAAALLDITKHKVHAAIAEKKWGEYEAARAAAAAPCPLARFDKTALALQKGLLATVMAYIAAANLYESSMRLPLCARRAEVRAARAAIKVAQKRLSSLASVHKELDALLAEARASGATSMDSDAHVRRACVARAAELFVERFEVIGELQHLAFECAFLLMSFSAT